MDSLNGGFIDLSPVLLVTIIWVLVISVIGMLPMRFHWRFGLPMLLLFPVILLWLGWSMGIWWALALLAGALSIYRYPARHYGRMLWRKLRGVSDS